MKLWIVSRNDDVGYDENEAVLVRAETAEDALYAVCGGPDPDLPDLRAFDRRPMIGFKSDRSNAVVSRLTDEGKPGVLMNDYHAG